ncbi:MAG: hypothetical protein LBD23_03770 [Oscillospiraceae bacterium]|jgi:hypothetical protein|nr:hypothetical protein [Oscillospiraceae bacterium]
MCIKNLRQSGIKPEGGAVKIKKPLFPIIMIISGIIAGFLISSAIYAFTGFSVFSSVKSNTESANDTANADITMLAYKVLESVRDGDFYALSRIVHPEYGVVLSPCATINLTTDRHFSAEQIATLDTDTTDYIWGIYNESGEPIVLTPLEYINEFIPAANHIEAPVIGINQIIKSGNALENITDVFPNVQFVDFHISEGESSEEIDWSSLRLGFEKYNNSLRLIAIVYSRWTV